MYLIYGSIKKIYFVWLFCYRIILFLYKQTTSNFETVHLFIRVIQTLVIEVLFSLFITGGINKPN